MIAHAKRSINRLRIVDRVGIALDTEKIKRLRQKREWTQAQAAKAVGIGVARWNDIESGRRANVTLETLDRIAAALGVRAKDLLK